MHSSKYKRMNGRLQWHQLDFMVGSIKRIYQIANKMENVRAFDRLSRLRRCNRRLSFGSSSRRNTDDNISTWKWNNCIIARPNSRHAQKKTNNRNSIKRMRRRERERKRSTAKGLFTCLHSTQTSSAYKLNARIRARLKNEWSKSLFELELLHAFHLHAQQLLLIFFNCFFYEVHYLLSDNLHTNRNTIGSQQNPLKNTPMPNVSPGNWIKPFGDDSIISISI